MKISVISRLFLFLFFLLLIFGTGCKKDEDEDNVPDGPVTDADGNEYTTVMIGDQEWMVENLQTTRLNDDSPIPEIQDNSEWADLESPGLCWYNNNETANKVVYGALYNWYTIITGKLCPAGWHVPSAGEWIVLNEYLGDSAASKLKETGNTHWSSANLDATNSTGFTALPGGIRKSGTGYDEKGVYGFWWTATQDQFNNTRAMAREMNQFSRDGSELVYDKSFGLSVRCVKD
jgi:uncharacterized protein (TIGR02145 family)